MSLRLDASVSSLSYRSVGDILTFNYTVSSYHTKEGTLTLMGVDAPVIYPCTRVCGTRTFTLSHTINSADLLLSSLTFVLTAGFSRKCKTCFSNSVTLTVTNEHSSPAGQTGPLFASLFIPPGSYGPTASISMEVFYISPGLTYGTEASEQGVIVLEGGDGYYEVCTGASFDGAPGGFQLNVLQPGYAGYFSFRSGLSFSTIFPVSSDTIFYVSCRSDITATPQFSSNSNEKAGYLTIKRISHFN